MANEHQPRDLGLFVTHDNGDEVRYSIEYERPAPQERDGANGSGASMLFYCNWKDRFKMKECLLGYNEIKDVSGTRTLHRVNPMAYHNGYINGTNEYEGWVYCIDTETYGENELPTLVADATEAGIINIDQWPHFMYAKMRAQFVSLLHDVKTDDEIVVDGERREWLRNCIIEDKPGGKYTQDRQQVFRWVDDETPVKFAPAFWDAYEDIVVHWLDVPWVPLKAIRNCIGRVNDANILKGARGLPDGIPGESALLVAAEITVKPKQLNRRYADITYFIRRVQKPKQYGDANDYGHNHLPKIVEASTGPTGVMRREFIRISIDGKAPYKLGNQLYDEVDYDQLFSVPASVDL